MQDTRQRQVSDLVSTRLPEFVRVDHPTLVAFLEAYYEWLQVSDRGGKLLSPMSLGDVIDVDDTMSEFLDHFKKEYLFNFPEQLAISKATGKPVDVRKLIKNIKAFYQAKGTEKSYEFLFRILYDVGVEFYYPKKDILRVSDGKWFEKNSLKITNSLGNQIFESVGRIVYQRNGSGEITASAKVTDISVYQEGLYEVAELNIVGKNGTFQVGKPISFDTDLGTLTELKVYSVVSSVTINNGGTGYAVGDTVVFTTAVGDSGISARGTVSLVTSSGAIRRIRIDNFGLNYTVAPTVSVQSLGGSGFSGTVSVGSLCRSEGYYLNYDGRISTDKVLQDNHYYQDYSYVLKTEVVIDRYSEAIRKLVHPAGTAMFGQILIKRCAYEDLNNTSALIRYEVPIIGHYAPYTFLTYDNLQDWFKYVDPFTGGLTSAGYDPNVHDSIIRNCSITGNPISSGIPFEIPGVLNEGGFLGVPTDSIPDFSIPISGLPETDTVFSGGGIALGNPLGEFGFKNSYPFWFIYEHPNRRILEPTIAQVWRNQIVDGLTFGWQWSEHCSVTGGNPPSGWTADFYGESPVEKKYAFLKYTDTSEFRKITARAFFEIPLGVPFDCRSVETDSMDYPSVAFASPKNGSRVSTDFNNLSVTLEYTNQENNQYLPLHQKAKTIQFLVDGVPATPNYRFDFGTTSFSVTVPLGRHRLSLTPLNLNNHPSSAFSTAEISIITESSALSETIESEENP